MPPSSSNDFTWSEFCDWYVEMSKGRLKDEASRPTAQRVLVEKGFSGLTLREAVKYLPPEHRAALLAGPRPLRPVRPETNGGRARRRR